MTGTRRTWLDRLPAGVVAGSWLLSLLWTGWWMWQLLAKSGIYIGPGILFAVWFVPMLPLFLVTSFWLRRRGTAVFWLPGAVLGVAVLAFAVPYRLAITPPLLYGLMAVLALVPVGSTIAATVLVFRTGRPDAGGSPPPPGGRV